jgi:hypothetical protein
MAPFLEPREGRSGRVRQPARRLDHLGECRAFFPLQQGDDRGALGLAFGFGLRGLRGLLSGRGSGRAIGVNIDCGAARVGDEHAEAVIAVGPPGAGRVSCGAFLGEAALREGGEGLGQAILRVRDRGDAALGQRYFRDLVLETYLIAAKTADKLRYLGPAQSLLALSLRLLVAWLILMTLIGLAISPTRPSEPPQVSLEQREDARPLRVEVTRPTPPRASGNREP